MVPCVCICLNQVSILLVEHHKLSPFPVTNYHLVILTLQIIENEGLLWPLSSRYFITTYVVQHHRKIVLRDIDGGLARRATLFVTKIVALPIWGLY